MFTKRHYEAIAKRLAIERKNELPNTTYTLKELVRWLSELFEEDNLEKFDIDRFVKACGGEIEIE